MTEGAEPDWPDWQDSQRKVWVLVQGVKLHGTLQAYDVGCDGTDEYPIWSVDVEGVAEISLVDASEWGYEESD